MTEEKMKEFSRAIIPYIESIREITKNFGILEGVRIYASDDYASVESRGFEDWELVNYGDKYEIKKETRITINTECEEE